MAQDWAWTTDVSSWVMICHSDKMPFRNHWHWLGCRVSELGELSRMKLRYYRIQMRFARKWERFLGIVAVPTPPSPDRPHGRVQVDRKSDRSDDEARNRGKP